MFHVFMGQVKTEEARQSIQDIDSLINLILFYDTVRENGMAMREEWTEILMEMYWRTVFVQNPGRFQELSQVVVQF